MGENGPNVCRTSRLRLPGKTLIPAQGDLATLLSGVVGVGLLVVVCSCLPGQMCCVMCQGMVVCGIQGSRNIAVRQVHARGRLVVTVCGCCSSLKVSIAQGIVWLR